MTDEERFERVLAELRTLIAKLAPLQEHLLVIGGQVIALEAKKRGLDSVIEIELPTGPKLSRGFSYEPDLLLDLDGAQQFSELLVDVLRESGYQRKRDFRWSKVIDADLTMELDLFRPSDADLSFEPTGMTPIDATLALARPHRIDINLANSGGTLTARVPDPVGFLSMKLDAKRTHRPNATKDCFDIVAYVALLGTKTVSEALAIAGADGKRVHDELAVLFRDVDSPGVLDVLDASRTLDRTEQELVAQAVVDLFLSLSPPP